MNPGYLSLILIGISLVLLATGWRTTLLGDVSHRAILTFFIMWAAGAAVTIHSGNVKVSGVYPVLIVSAAFGIVALESLLERANAILLGFWYGPFVYLLSELMIKSPVLVIHNPSTDVPFAVAVMAAIIQKSPAAQLSSLTIGLLAADALSAYAHRAWHGVSLGSAQFQDGWWLSALTARMIGAFLHNTVHSVREAISSWNERRKGGSGNH